MNIKQLVMKMAQEGFNPLTASADQDNGPLILHFLWKLANLQNEVLAIPVESKHT